LIVIAAWIAALFAALAISHAAGSNYQDNFHLPGFQSQQAIDLLRSRFPARGGDQATIVFHSAQPVTAATVQGPMEAMFEHVRALPHVTGVVSPYAHGSQAISRDGHTAVATVLFDKRAQDLPKKSINDVIAAAQRPARPGLQIELGGQPIEAVQRTSPGSATMIGLLAAMIILLLTFGSVVAMGMPLITALFALGTALGIVGLLTHVFDVADFTPQLAAMIGLGVGIDYALFVVTRYRTGLQEGLTVEESVTVAMDTSGRAVLFAGITVVVALLGQLLLGVDFLHGPAIGSSVAVALTMLAALTLLPAMLSTVGKRIDRLHFGRRRSGTGGEGAWARWSRLIQRRPWTAAITSGALLIVLAIPAFSLHLGSADAGTDPANTTTRHAYDLLAKGFWPGYNGPLQLVVRLPQNGDTAGLAQLSDAVAAEHNVVKVAPPALNPAHDTAVINVYPQTSPQDQKTKNLLTHLRNDVVPPIEKRTGIAVYIGGTTAVFADFSTLLSSKLPLFIGVVVLISALLLMAVFRSVLVPLKAIAMNLLTFIAAFGVVVAVFQWGWLGSLIGVDQTQPIAAFLPVMVFAIVFGLSMDYEVFLLSRMHEEYERHGDASEAVAFGLSATGRVITAAAAIMVCVFGSFVLGSDVTVKLFGLGLATAVFIDAVIIRSILVPALMELFGDRAWWIPGWLDRVLPRLNVDPAHQPDAGSAQSEEEDLVAV
jgi:RND superfamily putative drug exporter